MPIGFLLLVIAAVWVIFGLAEGILYRIGLNNKTALIFFIIFIFSSFISDVQINNILTVDIASIAIPIIFVMYLFINLRTKKQKIKTVLVSIAVGIVVLLISQLLSMRPEMLLLIYPQYIYGIIGGIVAYVLGRSVNIAFTSGIFGIIIYDIIRAVIEYTGSIYVPVKLGGSHILDAAIISGFTAVLALYIVQTINKVMIKT